MGHSEDCDCKPLHLDRGDVARGAAVLGQPIDPARGLEDEIPLEISDFQGTVNLPRRVYIYI